MAESVASGPCIGILALQGAFEEHRKIVQELGARTVEVRVRMVHILTPYHAQTPDEGFEVSF